MNYLKKFRNIRTFLLDVDGVLTSGHILLDAQGNMLRSLSVRDGYAMRVAARRGYRIAIISGGTTPGGMNRFKELGLKDIHFGVQDKVAVYQQLVEKYQLDPETVLYLGDDLPDLEVMRSVGLPCCPRDAVDEIRDLSLYISPKAGGEGCVRDVIEKVLKLRGDWPGYPTISI